MMMRALLLILIALPVAGHALPEEEKTRACRELSNKTVASQRKIAFQRCVEWATNECDRIERQFHESCMENSHLDNAIRYDFERGNFRSCEAAVMKRETHRVLCDGLRQECRTNKVTIGDSSATGTCQMFRDEDDKRVCVEVEKQADRITAAAKEEKIRCEAMRPKATAPAPNPIPAPTSGAAPAPTPAKPKG